MYKNNYKICRGCIYSHLNYCSYFKKDIPSVVLNDERCQLACIECYENDQYEPITDLSINNIDNKVGYFHVPGPENLNLFEVLIKMKKNYPEAFYQNRIISEVYGDFDGAIWNGRTPNFGNSALSIQKIDAVRQRIENLGISMNLTWNNHLISGNDVYDRFCNAITEVFHNGKHSITVASSELCDYLQNKYPNFKYYKSVITTEKDEDFYQNDNRFDMFLMNRKFNNNWERLLQIPLEKRSNIEFLCNDACTPICNRMGHYNIVNSCLINRSDESCIGNYCTIDHDFILYNANRWPINIQTEQIDKYINNNFIHFKLCSRRDPFPILALKTSKYLVKPEYVEDALGWCVNNNLITEDSIKRKRYFENKI